MRIVKSHNILFWIVASFAIAIAIMMALSKMPSMQSVTDIAVSPTVNVKPQSLFRNGTTPASLSDDKIKFQFASTFDRRDDIDSQTAFEIAMKESAFHNAEPIDPETGQAQHGYFARSLFDAFEFVGDNYSNPEDAWKHATELHLYWQNGALHGNFGAQFHTYRFEDGESFAYVPMNIVFDLPSGRHKYMTAMGYEATDGGVVIDDTAMPLMLANILTSQYMHIFVPSYDQPSEKTELVFWTDSFKDLLGDKDRAQAVAAQTKADDVSVPYDHQEEKQSASQAPENIGAQ